MVTLDERHLCAGLVCKASGKPGLIVGSSEPLVVGNDASSELGMINLNFL